MKKRPPIDFIWHPYTRHSAAAQGLPVMARGAGPYLFDTSGRRYLDAISSWWACALGHNPPRVRNAIRRQARILDHSILGNLSHPGALALAEQLARLMPDPDRRVLFASDGASAVEAALRIARQAPCQAGAPERTRIVSLRDAYHGDTLGAVAAGYIDSFHRSLKPVLTTNPKLPVPGLHEDPARAVAAARAIVRRHRGRIAAVIVEPLCLGASGMRMYPAEYLRALYTLAREEGALFIADEIAMGFGRTGRRFAFEHAGIDPDIVCLGKALSAGALPISAAVVRRAVYDTFTDTGACDNTFYHGHTFAGNPLACAAARAALEIYEAPGFYERVARKGRRMADRLHALRRHPRVKDVRCFGLIGAVELNDRPDEPGAELAQQIRIRLLRRGILLRPLGPVVYLMPPLTLGNTTLDRLTDELITAVNASR